MAPALGSVSSSYQLLDIMMVPNEPRRLTAMPDQKNMMSSIPMVSMPLALQPWRWILDPVGLLVEAFKDDPDMALVRVTHMSPNPQVLVSDPKCLQFLFSRDNNRGLSTPGETNRIFSFVMGDYSTFVIDGDPHRRQRQLLTPPFHGDRLKTYGDLISNLTNQVMAGLIPGLPFSAREVMLKISMGVMLQAVFGLHEGDRYQRIEALLSSFLNLLTTPRGALLLYFKPLRTNLGPWSPGGRIHKLKNDIHEHLLVELSERRHEMLVDAADSGTTRTDILSLLMNATDSDGHSMCDQELQDELLTLLVAGHETTATALTWALYWIYSLPEVRERLLDEIVSLGKNPHPESIARLPYLNAVCYETLRIYPVVMVTLPRRIEEPLVVNEHKLNPGQIVLGCIYSLHHRKDLYPNPDEFRPERFMERDFGPFEFMPFGAGSRRCVGAAFAVYEMKLVLAKLLVNWNLERVDQTSITPRRRGLTLGPSRPVWFTHRESHPINES